MPQVVAQALLFDLDGTLVDSSASVRRNWARLAARLGRTFDEVEPFIHGIPTRQAVRMMDPTVPDDVVEELNEFMIEAESTDTGDVVAMPGAARALDELPTRRWAVVTSGSRRLATARLRAAGLPMPRFLVTADDVTVGKPDPAPFLLGAETVGQPPARCLAFEDAPAGIRSAEAAGVPVIGILSTHSSLPGRTTVKSLSRIEFSADRLGVVVSW